MELIPSVNLINIIKNEEGFRPNQYPDGGSNAIGYGNHYYYPNGLIGGAVKIPKDYGPLNEEQAHNLCVDAIKDIMRRVNLYIKRNDLKQCEFEALVSIAYNCGVGNLISSGLLMEVNANPKDPRLKQSFINCNAPSKDLKDRRVREYTYYSTGIPDYHSQYTPTNEDYEISNGGSAVSNNSLLQVRYINTNYCDSIICTEEPQIVSGGINGSTGGVPQNKPEEKKSGTVYGNQAANALIDALKQGYDISNWECCGFYQTTNNKFVKFTATISKSNRKVGSLTVRINDNRTYAIIIAPNDLDTTLIYNNQILSQNTQQTSINIGTPLMNQTLIPSLNVTTLTSNDINQILIDNILKGRATVLEKFHYILLNAKKTSVGYSKLEDIFNNKVTNSSKSTKASMYDVLYVYFDGQNKYTKIKFASQYEKICSKGGGVINDTGVAGVIGVGRLVYFTDIKNDCDCKGKTDYFGEGNRAIAIIFTNNKIVRFRTGYSNGSGEGWDDIHMILK